MNFGAATASSGVLAYESASWRPATRVNQRAVAAPMPLLAWARSPGDHNPLHYEEAAAAAFPFGEIIVQGGITSGVLNALRRSVPGTRSSGTDRSPRGTRRQADRQAAHDRLSRR